MGVLNDTIPCHFCPSMIYQSAAMITVNDKSTSVETLSQLIESRNIDTSSSILESIGTADEHQFNRLLKDPKIHVLIESVAHAFGNQDSQGLIAGSACKILSRLPSEHLTPKINRLKVQWLKTGYIPYEFMSNLLKLDANYLVYKQPSEEDLEFFFAITKKHSNVDVNVETRMAVAHSLNTLKRIIDIRHKYFVEYALLIDVLLTDDDKDVRRVAGSIVSYYLKANVVMINSKESRCDSINRHEFLCLVCQESTSIEELIDYFIRMLSKTEIEGFFSTAQRLFDVENLNAFREPVVDVLLSVKSLRILIERLPESQRETLNSKLEIQITQRMQIICGIEDLQWNSNFTPVFNYILETTGLALVMNSQAHLDSLINLDIHGWIKNLITDKTFRTLFQTYCGDPWLKNYEDQ